MIHAPNAKPNPNAQFCHKEPRANSRQLPPNSPQTVSQGLDSRLQRCQDQAKTVSLIKAFKATAPLAVTPSSPCPISLSSASTSSSQSLASSRLPYMQPSSKIRKKQQSQMSERILTDTGSLTTSVDGGPPSGCPDHRPVPSRLSLILGSQCRTIHIRMKTLRRLHPPHRFPHNDMDSQPIPLHASHILSATALDLRQPWSTSEVWTPDQLG